MDFGVQAPEKNGYKFSEVTSLTGVKPYVLRFWESEFEQISPQVQESGEKLYDKSDLLAVKTVKKLLFEDKLSIPEAKVIMDKEMQAIEASPVEEEPESPSVDLQKQSQELKVALEDLIEKGAESSSESFSYKASPLASRIKREVEVRERNISEKDVVNLVSAKKKLTKLLGAIQDIEERRGWNA